MSTQIKRRRGTGAEIASFTPAIGEWVHNTDDSTIHTGDGVKVGGYKIPNTESIINDLSQAYDKNTTDDIKSNTIVFPLNKRLTSKGFSSINDGGASEWYRSGLTGTPSTINASLGAVYDANGNGYTYIANTATATKEINPQVFGAKVDGTTDNSALITSLLLNYDTLRIPNNTDGMVMTQITLNEGKSIRGNGALSKIKQLTGATIWLFILKNKASIKDVRMFNSGGKDSGLTTQNCIYINTNVFETVVDGVWIDGFGGAGYTGFNSSLSHEGSSITNAKISNCNYGLDFGVGLEFIVSTSNSIFQNNTGARIRGGNVLMTGSNISDNGIGIELINGANDAHGQVTGCLINHNTTNAIVANNMLNGFTFTGCQIHQNAPIHLLNCHNVRFVGGEKSTTGILEENCTECSFTNFDFIDGINNTPNYNATNSEVFYHDNFLPNTLAPTGFDSIEGGWLSLIQTAVSANMGAGDNDFAFDTVTFNSITANQNYAFQTFYTAGEFTADTSKVKRGFDLNFKLQLSIAKVGAAAFLSSEVRVKIVSTATGDIMGIATPLKNSSETFHQYFFNGTTTRARCKIVIENNTGTDIFVYQDRVSPNIDSKCEVTGW